MQRTFAALIEAMGGKVLDKPQGPLQAIEAAGSVIHEVGGTIMGGDPKTSVTNRWNQTWDVKNLFVADGGPFCSNADKNPTLTIMALSAMAADGIVKTLGRA